MHIEADLILHHQQIKENKMKKIAFALQVFALITMLPLYVIIELNHSTAAPTKNKSVTEVSVNEKIIPTAFISK
jgi:uncharacterized alpha/beta hydrolase family protein